MSRHKTRQALALEFGATDIVSDRGEAGVARIKEMTKNVGADAVLECVGTNESMNQAIQCTRPGAMIGYVGVPHGVQLEGQSLFFSQTGMMGGPAPVRRFLPHKPRGVPRADDRRVLNGIFWVLRSGAPWRDLRNDFGPCTTCYDRFVRWRRAGSGAVS